MLHFLTHALPWFRQSFHSKFTNFTQIFKTSFFFSKIKTTFDRLPTFNSPHVIHVPYSSHIGSNDKVSPIHVYNLYQPKHKAIHLVMFKVRDYWFFILTKEVTIHKLSKTSVALFVFQKFSRPWKWRIIFPKLSKTIRTLLTSHGSIWGATPGP